MTKHISRLIETDFPIELVSVACSAEKSIRQEHISTLQMWWARRPLGVCRSAIFAALCPTPPSSLYTDRPRVSINSGAFAETLRYCALRTLDPSSNRRSGGVWDAF